MIETGELELRIDDQNWHCLPAIDATVLRSFEAAIAVKNLSAKETGATIILSDDASLKKLNAHWRDKPQATNVLSFPACPGEVNDNGKPYLGDMILAYGVVAREADAQGKALQTHLCHLVIHGALHLLGFDHMEDKAARQMEDLERTAMKSLELPDPYLPIVAKQETNA